MLASIVGNAVAARRQWCGMTPHNNRLLPHGGQHVNARFASHPSRRTWLGLRQGAAVEVDVLAGELARGGVPREVDHPQVWRASPIIRKYAQNTVIPGMDGLLWKYHTTA
jgi:hypothetical protein